MRERCPNADNQTELQELLDKTRETRRQWIQDESPTISSIFKRYPRLFDATKAVGLILFYWANDMHGWATKLQTCIALNTCTDLKRKCIEIFSIGTQCKVVVQVYLKCLPYPKTISSPFVDKMYLNFVVVSHCIEMTWWVKNQKAVSGSRFPRRDENIR